jgi:hypothetical protein
MKKKIIFIYQNPFTKFTEFKNEILELRKENNVEIHDLSNLIYSKRFATQWKIGQYKAIKFSSLFSWIKNFRKEKNFIMFNKIKVINFNSFVIELVIRLSKIPVIIEDVYYIFSEEEKKTSKFILNKILRHRFNLLPYIFGLKNKTFTYLIKFISYQKVFVLTNNFKKININFNYKSITKINYNDPDYSNFILYNKKNKIHKKKYALFLDSGGPYFEGDAGLNNASVSDDGIPHNCEKYYKNLNSFFSKLEKLFKVEILIIPHPKYKSINLKKKSLNPFFNEEKVVNDLDALPKLSSNCSFFINYMSTAQTYAIVTKKPTFLIYCSKYYKSSLNLLATKRIANHIDQKVIDISNFSNKEIFQAHKINLKKYKNYKYNYLTPKNKSVENNTNSEILTELILKLDR